MARVLPDPTRERILRKAERFEPRLDNFRGYRHCGQHCAQDTTESFTKSQVRNSPPRKSGHKEEVPWAEAVAFAGSEERLKQAAQTVNTWRFWRNTKKAVPAYIVLRLVKENMRLQGVAPQPSDPVPLLEALERVRQYWGTKRWEKLDLALELVGEPYRATDLRK